MITEIRVPKVGMSQAEITVVSLCQKNAAPVSENDLVVVIETAKVSQEICTPVSGLVFYLCKVKDKKQIGGLLSVIADSVEEFETFRKGLSDKSDRKCKDDFFFDEDAPAMGVSLSFDDEEDRPAGKKTGASGYTEYTDPVLDLENRNILKRIPFIGMRRTIADNLHRSLQVSAQLTIVVEADMTELSRFREELQLDYPDARITYVDLLVKLLPAVLKEFPLVNSAISGDEIICWNEYNIGVAMALEAGLVVPVIRNADKKSLVQISRNIKSLAKKAKDGALLPEHFEGGTFTLSSGGKVDTTIITPIINPPQSAILAIGQIGPRPAVFEGQLAIRTLTNLCLTHDHRVVDGVPASMFLQRLKNIIASPALFRTILK
jgi:pyruvate/2-oxoglutarate dehydrogenase complex dihydrolipoamide acyltransferase (E2) component